jgi:hypothetical protein
MSGITALVSALALSQAHVSPSTPSVTPPWSVEVTADGVRLTADVYGQKAELSTLKLGPVNDAVRRGNVIYVARSAGGIQIIDAENPRSPVAAGGFGAEVVVTHLAVKNDQLVALSKEQSFTTYDLTKPLHPIALETAAASLPPGELTEKEPPPAEGTVLTVRDGVVVIKGGTKDGFALGRNVAIYSQTRISDKDKLAREAGMQTPGLIVAVVRLERVEEDRSLAAYGRGDDPTPGDRVVVTDDATTASLSGPRMIPFEWRLDLAIRPFLGVGSTGYPFGMLIDTAVAYYFQALPLRVEVGLAPIGFVVGGEVPYNPINFEATLAFYSQFVEVGLGGGVASSIEPASPLAPQTANAEGTIDQSLRIGALDGVNFIWNSAIGFGANSFELTSLRMQLNFPVATRLTLGFEGGGGPAYAYGDVVLRTYLGGMGGPGTFILSGGIGGAGAIDNSTPGTFSGNPSAAGPSLVLELEVRL